jgi:hypothetical protein
MVFGAAFILYTAQYLPDPLATHFSADGRADGWMARGVYIGFSLTALIGLPALIAYLLFKLPRSLPNWTNIPYREYWLAPERRDDSLGFLTSQGYRLGSLIVMFTIGLHYTILVANRHSPQVLPMSTFLSLVGAFLIVLCLWVMKIYRRFPNPDHR